MEVKQAWCFHVFSFYNGCPRDREDGSLKEEKRRALTAYWNSKEGKKGNISFHGLRLHSLAKPRGYLFEILKSLRS